MFETDVIKMKNSRGFWEKLPFFLLPPAGGEEARGGRRSRRGTGELRPGLEAVTAAVGAPSDGERPPIDLVARSGTDRRRSDGEPKVATPRGGRRRGSIR